MPGFGIFETEVEKIRKLTNVSAVEIAIRKLRLMLAEEDIEFQLVKTVSIFLAEKERDCGLATGEIFQSRMHFIEKSFQAGIGFQKTWRKPGQKNQCHCFRRRSLQRYIVSPVLWLPLKEKSAMKLKMHLHQ